MKFNPFSLWFQLKSVFSYDWDFPFFLYLLPLPLVIFAFKKILNRNNQARIVMSFSKPLVQQKFIRILSFIPEILQGLCLFFVILTLASPYKKIVHSEIKKEGVEMALAIDISASMQTKDVFPSRLQVAKKLAIDFVKQRKNDRISLIAFAGAPYLASPLTPDSSYLIQALQPFESQLIREQGTALGDALGMSINQIRDEKNPKKIAILLSDGNSTAGNLDPITSAELAKSFGIKVYTIAVGSLQPSLDPVDESTLRSIAETSNGEFFRATNEQTLAQIFQEIDQLEKTRTLKIRWEEHEDLKGIFLRIAFLFFCLSLLLKISPITNILED